MNELYIIKMFLSNMKCGNCGEHCDPADIGALGHQEDTWLFSIYCSSCNSRGLIYVTIKISEEAEAVTELTEAERSYFFTPISSSDILDMHIFLEDFNGDFASLFTFSPPLY
jgi:hypothetical protein